jgi:dipeptidyl aminopeptidase/acylaminoacyl peptidase
MPPVRLLCLAVLILTSILTSIPAAPAAAQPATNAPRPADGEIVADLPYAPPPFAQLPEAMQREVGRQGSPEDYEAARGDARFGLRKLTYGSDGLRVTAYLYRPATPGPGRLPAVVYNRGSWVLGDQAPVLLPIFHRLASAGFVVIAPQYRGSDGGEGHDEMGGADVNDVASALALVRALPYVEAENIFLYGHSRGGMMTYQALRDGAAVRAAATVGGFTDLEATIAGDARAGEMASQIWPDFERRRAEIAERRSAVRWAEKMTAVPLLILHGGKDPQISPRQSLALAQRLQELGRPYEIHVFAGEGHVLSGRAEARDRQVADWFLAHRKQPAK